MEINRFITNLAATLFGCEDRMKKPNCDDIDEIKILLISRGVALTHIENAVCPQYLALGRADLVVGAAFRSQREEFIDC